MEDLLRWIGRALDQVGIGPSLKKFEATVGMSNQIGNMEEVGK